jgi:hypothetical protein
MSSVHLRCVSCLKLLLKNIQTDGGLLNSHHFQSSLVIQCHLQSFDTVFSAEEGFEMTNEREQLKGESFA